VQSCLVDGHWLVSDIRTQASIYLPLQGKQFLMHVHINCWFDGRLLSLDYVEMSFQSVSTAVILPLSFDLALSSDTVSITHAVKIKD